MTPEAFEKQYLFRTKRMRRLRVPRQVQCTFLDPDGCRIHDVKPVQCRTFPFWPELIESPKSWAETGKLCPGVGKGELVNIELAQTQAEEMRAAHPYLNK